MSDRLRQILARIGFGISALASLSWVLWPEDWSVVLEPEPFFVFGTALVVWVFAEFHNPGVPEKGASSEVSRDAEESASRLDAMDKKVAMAFLDLYSVRFVEVFSGPGFPKSFNYEYLSRMESFQEQASSQAFVFSSEELDKDLKTFSISLSHFLNTGLTAFDVPDATVVHVRPEIYNQVDDDGDEAKTLALKQLNKLREDADEVILFGSMLLKRLRAVDPLLVAENH